MVSRFIERATRGFGVVHLSEEPLKEETYVVEPKSAPPMTICGVSRRGDEGSDTEQTGGA